MGRRVGWFLMVAGLALALAGCSSGPRKRVFAPGASVQELAVQADGSWQVQLRVQSFSNVPHTVASAELRLKVDGIEAGRLSLPAALNIGPQSAEVETLRMTPSTQAAARVAAALEGRRSVRYGLSGTLHSTEPDKRNDEIDFDGQLWPMPGLSGVLR